MGKPGRHAPCPCGSGAKYENCCQQREVLAHERRDAHRRALVRAIEWLRDRHARPMLEAIDREYLGHLPKDRRAEVARLPEALRWEINANGTEWLIAEGRIELKGGTEASMVRVSDLLLGLGGPVLLAEERAFLEELTRPPIGLYEVLESDPGNGLRLRSLGHPERDVPWVQERRGSEHLVRGDVMGARLVRVRDHVELSGAVYAFPHRWALELPDELRQVFKKIRRAIAPGGNLPDGLLEATVAQFVIGRWLLACLTPPEMPAPMDAASGDPILLITDHYEVLDWDALAGALQAESDVEGSRDDGWTKREPPTGTWTRRNA